MEYSKEDLMEAKKQIWGVGENMGTEESKKIWEENAQFWDTVDLKVSLIGAQKHFQTPPSDFVHPYQNLRIYDLHPVVAFQLYRELKYLADYSRRFYRSP